MAADKSKQVGQDPGKTEVLLPCRPGSKKPPAGESTLSQEAAPASRDTILGPYVLRQKVGEGGMGEVWVAQQTAPVRRTVAVKIVKKGMDTRQVIARFEAERQALALMDHPSIARVFDAGMTPGGRPYFVMEFVRGVPITDYCDRRKLSTRARLDLFKKVCEGVQHAHQKAVVHRDLKPSNILVTEVGEQPQPKIIDFGVAKATAQRLTERTMFTELGQLIGTPEYMSPEQADPTGEDIDTRSDVYSLGVVLYELLVGVLPFDSRELRRKGWDGIRRTIRDQEPPRPSTRLGGLGEDSLAAARNRAAESGSLRRQLAGDLDWITLKALEKDRNRRYGSPQELANDLTRYLEDLPVEARPPSVAYRTRKFWRRHRSGVAAAATLLVLLIAFAFQMMIQARRLARERDEKQVALGEAQAVTAFLTDMLAAVNPLSQGRDVTVRQVLDEASGRLGETFADQPLVKARLQQTIGMSYVGLGLYDPGEEQLRAAAEAQSRELGPEHPETLEAVFVLANALYERGRYDEAERLHREVLASRRRLLGDEADATLWSVGNLGFVLAAQQRYEEAVPLLEEALRVRRRTLGVDNPTTLILLNNLAGIYHMLRRYTEAEPLYGEALELLRQLRGREHPDTLGAMNNLAELYLDERQPQRAEPLLEETLGAKQRVLGADHPSTLYTLGIMARLDLALGRLDAAEQRQQEAYEGQLRLLGAAHPRTLQAQAVLAEVLRRRGRLTEAEELLVAHLRVSGEELGADHPASLKATYELACLRAEQGRKQDALDLLAGAVRRGWADPAVFDETAFAAWREDPALQEILARVRERLDAS